MFRWRRPVCGAMVTLSVCLLGVVAVARQAAPAPAQQMSEEVFQNIHPEFLDPTWLGHSIGHWEKDALVIPARG